MPLCMHLQLCTLSHEGGGGGSGMEERWISQQVSLVGIPWQQMPMAFCWVMLFLGLEIICFVL